MFKNNNKGTRASLLKELCVFTVKFEHVLHLFLVLFFFVEFEYVLVCRENALEQLVF